MRPRLKIGGLHWLFTGQLWLRLGISPAALRPIDRIGAVRCPVFVIAGERDRRTTLAESRRLFAAAPAPKRFWAVPGAAHEDFHAVSPAAYERKVIAFLQEVFEARPPPESHHF